MSASAKRSRPEESSSDEASSDDDDGSKEGQTATAPASATGAGISNLEKLKREKRLAMNRESARVRRRRKKDHLELLQQKSDALQQKQQNLALTNTTLKTRVRHLETELANIAAGMTGPGRAGAIGLGAGSMDPTNMFTGTAAARAAAAGPDALSMTTNANNNLSLGVAGLGAVSSSSAFGGMGLPSFGVSDPEIQYLQMQQQLLASQSAREGGIGQGTSTAAALISWEELHRRNQLAAALRAGSGPGGQISDLDLNQRHLPGFLSQHLGGRLRGTEGLIGRNMDRAMSPADSAARLGGHSSAAQGAGSQRRDLKKELLERLADTNKKFPPRGGG